MSRTVRDLDARKQLTYQRRLRKQSDRNKIVQKPARDAPAARRVSRDQT